MNMFEVCNWYLVFYYLQGEKKFEEIVVLN